jgi:hypothetical protein
MNLSFDAEGVFCCRCAWPDNGRRTRPRRFGDGSADDDRPEAGGPRSVERHRPILRIQLRTTKNHADIVIPRTAPIPAPRTAPRDVERIRFSDA